MKDNLETYIYIFFAVVYVISRILKARSKQKQQQASGSGTNEPQQASPQHTREAPQPPPRKKKAFSFDDILKEFEKNIAGENFQETELVEEIQLEKPTPVAATAAIEEKPNPFQNYKDMPANSALKDIKRINPVFERSENFEIKKQVVHPYVKMIRDPDGFKNAVVLSEIINTKYF